MNAELASFLKTHRLRIPTDAGSLGPWQRLPIRCGRPVTQEEVAEALGISRNWYRRIESGEAAASTRLLGRLAKIFAFSPEERTKLFVLGIPEITQGANELNSGYA